MAGVDKVFFFPYKVPDDQYFRISKLGDISAVTLLFCN